MSSDFILDLIRILYDFWIKLDIRVGFLGPEWLLVGLIVLGVLLCSFWGFRRCLWIWNLIGNGFVVIFGSFGLIRDFSRYCDGLRCGC